MQKNYTPNYKAFIKKKTDKITVATSDILSDFRDEINCFSTLPLGISPTFYILNYETKEYEFVSKEFQYYSKYKAEAMIEGGIEKLLSIYHKDDLELYSKQIFVKNLEVIQNTKPEERGLLIFTNTYRIYNNDKTISHLLQKVKFIPDPITGLPIYAFGCVNNLTNHNAFNRELYHQIEKIDELNYGKKTLILSDSYKVYEEDKKLTPQEKRIIELLIKGLTTKEIAQKLFISHHTVNIHRSNILTKTNSKNVVQLISNFMNSNI